MVTMLHIVETLTPYGGVPVKLLRLAEHRPRPPPRSSSGNFEDEEEDENDRDADI